jgi:hypothetical protein
MRVCVANFGITGNKSGSISVSASGLCYRPVVFNLGYAYPGDKGVHVRGYTKTSYINQNETQESLGP